MRCLFWCHTEYIIRSSFAIPVHKMLEAAPQHQTPNDAYFVILQASLDSVPKELKSGKS